mmetsp:Transcript_5582/g.21987  ORF Transcript_5582/g.21987 Transcript_5582/m.21987 type:complete len:247 (+) Transcript_5582:2725-3465(+)
MRPPQLLNGLVCTPRKLHRDVHSSLLILQPPIRMQADARRGSVRYDCDVLVAVREALALDDVDFLHGFSEVVSLVVRDDVRDLVANYPHAAPGHFGDVARATELVNEHVKRIRGQRELLHHPLELCSSAPHAHEALIFDGGKGWEIEVVPILSGLAEGHQRGRGLVLLLLLLLRRQRERLPRFVSGLDTSQSRLSVQVLVPVKVGSFATIVGALDSAHVEGVAFARLRGFFICWIERREARVDHLH